MEEGQNALEQFCLLAKGLRGRAVVGIIQQTLSSKRVFVFGELLAMPNVQALRDSEHAPHLELLEIFAYGTCSQYRAKAETLPKLSPSMLSKLRQLSLVSLARERSVVSYDSLLDEFDVANVRELEDAIIETIYAGLLVGKMDQRARVLRVSHAAVRDVKISDIGGLVAKLEAWAATAAKLSGELNANRAADSDHRAADKTRAADLEAKLDDIKKGLKDSENAGGAYDAMDVDRPKRRGKRSRMPFIKCGRGD